MFKPSEVWDTNSQERLTSMGVRSRIFLTIFLTLFLSVIATYFITERDLRRGIENQLVSELEKEANLIVENIGNVSSFQSLEESDAAADNLGSIIDSRVTLISNQGEVVGDSSLTIQEIALLDNHLNRLEVVEALKNPQRKVLRIFLTEESKKNIENNSPNGLLGINIGPNKDTENRVEDYLICFRKFHNLADYITINISSPNTENLRNFHKNEELDNLLKCINEEKKNLNSNVPIAVKVSPDIDEKSIDEISELFLKYNVLWALLRLPNNMEFQIFFQLRDVLNPHKELELPFFSFFYPFK